MPSREKRLLARALLAAVLVIAGSAIAATRAMADVDTAIAGLIADGEFAEAEARLGRQVDAAAPVASEAAIQLEILRRIRQDFPYTQEQILAELGKSIPGVRDEDIDRWREAGDLQARKIDGEFRFFRSAVGNLFRASAEARGRQPSPPSPAKKFALTRLIEELVRRSEQSSGDEIYPVKHKVRYELAVHEDHPRLKPGARVRAWLPFPQEYRQQREVKLVRSEPPHLTISPNGSPHRTIYFDETIADGAEPPRFRVEFEFVTSAYCPKLAAAKVEPYDVDGELYREYTAERPPHIVFTPEVRRLAAEIIGDETNPLEKARRVFRWVSANIPWCSEMEYSVIPNISAKGLTARRGDCGVQGLVFITLCRAASVPARWQSGWQTKPDDWNMHDWSEFYVEPWGWLPADASYGVREHADPRVRDFLCGNMDPYRLIVNLDYARPFAPPKTSFRSEPNDFQRGEVEIDGHNLYFDEWDYTFQVETNPLDD